MNTKHQHFPVIGFVRYSQRIAFANRTKPRDIFEKSYFEYRFKIFREVTLKSFQQQTNPNFKLFLLHSESMPREYQQWFAELEKSNSFLANVYLEDSATGFNRGVENTLQKMAYVRDVAITFRIDNDDAVQNNLIETLYTFLKKDMEGFVISAPTMNIIKRIGPAEYLMQDKYFPANAMGIAFVTGKENVRTIFSLGDHDLVNNDYSMIVLPKNTFGGLMTINGLNEINSIDEMCAIKLDEDGLKSYFRERNFPNLDMTCLRIFTTQWSPRQIKAIKRFVSSFFNMLRN